MEDQKKLSAKQFIRQKKLLMKNMRGKQDQNQTLTQFIVDGETLKFQGIFNKLEKENVITYLFSQDSMKQTPFMKMLPNPKIKEFLTIVNRKLQQQYQYLIQGIIGKIIENQYLQNDWRNKLNTLNRAVIKTIFQKKDQKAKSEIAQIILGQFSSKDNFISNLYQRFLDLNMVQTLFSGNKSKRSENDLIFILDKYYCPFALQLSEGNQKHQLYRTLQNYKQVTIKQKIWKNEDFIGAVKENIANEQILELRELKITFMHQLFLNENKLREIINVQQLMEASDNVSYRKMIKKIFSVYDSTEETPVDIGLRQWSYKRLVLLFNHIKTHENIRFSTNSLNRILYNHKLTQSEKESLIDLVLGDEFSERGFFDSIRVQKHVKLRNGNKQNIDVYINAVQPGSLVVYDLNAVISKKDNKNSYPLLNYLDHFREKSNLKIIEKLFPKNILDKKLTKRKIIAMIGCISGQKKQSIEKGTEGQISLQQILYYHMPLSLLVCKIQPCDCSQYLFNKIFTNYPELIIERQPSLTYIGISRHFLVTYLDNCTSLRENFQNKSMLEKVFQSKNSEKFIGKYNIYVQILKSLNHSIVFRSNSKQFLPQQIRKNLKEYFNSLPNNQLFKKQYFQQLSLYFFNIKLSKSKKQKYNPEKDWSLFNAQQICAKFKQADFSQYMKPVLQELSNVKAEEQKPKQLGFSENQAQDKNVQKIINKQKKQEKQKQQEQPSIQQRLAKIIMRYNSLSLTNQSSDEQINFEEVDHSWLKTYYRKKRTIKRLKRYLQKAYNSIQLSLYEEDLQQKIETVLQYRVDLFFNRRQVQQIIKKGDIKKSLQKITLKNQNLIKIVQNMIKRKTTFIKALIHLPVDQQIIADNLFKQKIKTCLFQTAFAYFKQRNLNSSRISPRFSYPQGPTQPISFSMFLSIRSLALNEQSFSQFRQDVNTESVLHNYYNNIQYLISQVSQLSQMKTKNKENEQKKQQKKKMLMQVWLIGQNWIKNQFQYNSAVKSMIQIQTNKKQISKEQKENCKQQQQNQQPLIPQLNESQQQLKSHYEYIGQKVLKKYHTYFIDLENIIKTLSIQQIFLMDSYIQNDKTSGILFVYKMYCSSNPQKIFHDRIAIKPLTNPLKGQKNHSSIRSIFIHQLKRFENKQFLLALNEIKKHNFINIGDIFHQINDQQKIIILLDYVLVQGGFLSNINYRSNYLISLIKQNLQVFSISILLVVEKGDFQFRFQEKVRGDKQQQKITVISCDSISFYSKCNMDTFQRLLMAQMKKYYSKSHKALQNVIKQIKMKQIVQNLVESQQWIKLLKLLQMTDFDNMQPLVLASFMHIGNNLISAKISLSQKQSKTTLDKILGVLFALYRALNIQFDQKIFVQAYKCSPSQAFQIMNPKQLSVQSFVQCLKAIPEQAKLFLAVQVEVDKSKQLPNEKYFKTNFPLTPYYYYKFGDCKWLLDLLRVERKVLTATGYLKRIDKTMQSLILLDKMQQNFNQFYYSNQQITLKCQKIFHSNTIKSIKKYPLQWFINYFAQHKLKSIQILTSQLIHELIDLQYISKENTLQILSTCKLDVIKYFCHKMKIQLNSYQTFKEIQNNFLINNTRYRGKFWEFLIQIDNQKFTVEFIRSYNLFQVFPKQQYQQILLNGIAYYKRLLLLSYFIEFWSKKVGKQLQYVFNKPATIQNYLIVLPEQAALSMNFYEYYFLVKSSKNECPYFYPSNRFLIQAEDNKSQLEKLNFVPQLKKRLQIMHIVSELIPNGGDIQFKKETIMKNLLSLQSNPKSELGIPDQMQPQKTQQQRRKKLAHKWKQSLEEFLRYLVQPEQQIFVKRPLGIFNKLLALVITGNKIGVQIKELEKIYPSEMKIIKSVDKYIYRDFNIFQTVKDILQEDGALKAIVLVNSFEFFMQNYKQSLQVVQKEDPSIYAKGVLLNLKRLQTSNQYRPTLQKFLSICFIQGLDSFFSSSYSNFLKRQIFSYCLMSLCEGNKFALTTLGKHLNLTPQNSGQILLETGLKMNDVLVKQGFKPSFNVMVWNNVIQQCLEVKFPLNKNEKDINLQKFIHDSIQILESKLQEKYKSRITNIRKIINQSVSKISKNQKQNIFVIITIIINQVYLYCVFYEFYNSIKKSLKIENDFQIDIQFSQNEFSLQTYQEKSNSINFVLPYEWKQMQKDIPLLQIDLEQILNKSQKHILLKNIEKNNQIVRLSEKYQNAQDSCFKNMKFFFDAHSFTKIKQFQALKKVVQYWPLTNNGISMIQRTLQDVDDRAFNDKTITYYSFSDVYGPIKLSDQNLNSQRFLNCLNFYELLPLPTSTVIVEYVEQLSNQKISAQERYITDFEIYVKYILNQVLDTHPVDKIEGYKFENRIQVSIDQQSLEIKIMNHNFSLINVLKCLSLMNSVSNQIRRQFQNRIDVRFDANSIMNLHKNILLQKKNLKEDASTYGFLKRFLKNKQNIDLIEKILLMIIEDAINIMKVVKGTIINYDLMTQACNDASTLYKIHDYLYVKNIDYSIQEQIFIIKLKVYIQKSQNSIQSTIPIDSSQLISRKQFLSSIFSSSEFLTDYFLQKSILTNQCMKISRLLTTKLNKTINFHINYKTLYNFIQHLKNQMTIKQIDGYLYMLRAFLMGNMQKKLSDYLTSQYVMDCHQILLLVTFQFLHNSLSSSQKPNISQAIITKQVQNLIKNQKQIEYFLQNKRNAKGLQLLEGFSQQISNFNDTAKNVFFIQIYKSYFPTLVTEGMTFIIGFKAANKQPTLIKFLKRQDIDKINIVDVSYMLLVSTDIPTNDEINHSKIIRIFISDLYKNIYRISEPTKNYLLSLTQEDAQLRNITTLLPIIPSNIAIDFENSKIISPSLRLKDNKDLKVFEITLQKQSKFKLNPASQEPILILNSLKKNHVLRKQIAQFVDNINKSVRNQQFKLIIDPSKLTNNIQQSNVAEVLKLALFDIQNSFSSFFSQPLRNPDLQACYSIEQKKSIKQNIYIQLRRQTFKKYFKSIRLQISNTKQPHLRIEKDQIIIEVSYDAQHKYVKEKQIACKILEKIVDNQLKVNQKKIKLQFDKKDLGITGLLNIFDLINTLQMQVHQIQKAKQIYSLLKLPAEHKKLYNTFSSSIIFEKDKKGYISCDLNSKCISLGFNIDKSQSPFFTSAFLLDRFLDNFKQNHSEHQNKTYYDFRERSIKIYGFFSNQLALIIQNKGKLQLLNPKVISQNPSNGKIQISQLLTKLNIISPYSIKYWIVDSFNMCSYYNYIYDFGPQDKLSNVNKKVNLTFTNQQISLFVSNQNSCINVNTCPITISTKSPNDNSIHSYQSILRELFSSYFQIKLFSRENAQLKFKFNNSLNASINLGSYKNIFGLKDLDIYNITVSSNGEAIIQNTKFLEIHFRNKISQSKDIKANQNDKKALKYQLIQPAQKSSQQQDNQIPSQKNKKSQNIESLVYVVNNQSKNFLTRAGEKRIDYIQMCDADFNPIQYKCQMNIYFKHINNLCKIAPEVDKKGLKIGLIWTPIVRGHYKVYLNGICLNPQYQIGVCAGAADPTLSTVQKPKVTKICFVQETQCTFNLKDTYGNIYTELEQSILGDGLIIDIESTNNPQLNKHIKKKEEPINKYGLKKVRFSIEDQNASESTKALIQVQLNKYKMSQFELQIQGQSLQQRKKNLQKDINNLNKGYYKDISVSRNNFLQDLFKIAQKSLLTNFSVKFAGEQGIDAGGLKRQFYDMIGSQIKNQKNPFFKPTDSRKNNYFINPQILKNKKKQNYMELFGKYLANSILNSYLLGINFSSVFIKLLYGDPTQFQDLLTILPQDQAKRYKYLVEAPEQDFEDLQIYFTVIVDKKKGKYIELKQDGANIQVAKHNVHEYLRLLTKVLIEERYKQIIESFKAGFETVMPLQTVRKWVRPHEFWCLTQGIKQINSQIVLNYIIFQGSSDQGIISWFRRYIKQSNLQILQGFLKFASGSSSVDFDQTSKITVTFENAGSNPKKLPISHTCWKQIIVPKYKSYEIMHKLLNAAFIFCSEGFGFG